MYTKFSGMEILHTLVSLLTTLKCRKTKEALYVKPQIQVHQGSNVTVINGKDDNRGNQSTKHFLVTAHELYSTYSQKNGNAYE